MKSKHSVEFWENLEWNLTAKEIAEKHDLSLVSVYYWANRLGKKLPSCRRGPKPVVDWSQVDLDQPIRLLAREYNVSESYISKMRSMRRKEKAKR